MNIQDRYSFSTWPSTPLPPVRLRRWPSIEVTADGWVGGSMETAHSRVPEWITVPDEIHLRNFGDTQIDSADSLVKLVRDCGFPLDPAHPRAGVMARSVVSNVAERHYAQTVDNLANQLPFGAPDLAERPHVNSAHLVEIALRVAFIRPMVGHVDSVLSGKPVEDHASNVGWLDFDDLDYRLTPELEDATGEQAAWMVFSGWLNAGLEGLSPRVVPPEYGQPDIDGLVDSFTAACVALFNDLVENVPYRRCEDETCQRLFKNQLGRARRSQYRSDAKFCTPQHAINQAQRERRRRNRDRKEPSDDQ